MKAKILLSFIIVAAIAAITFAQDPIPAKSEVVIPAKLEKRYPHVWPTSFTARAPTPPSATNPEPSDGIIYYETVPFNAATGEVNTDPALTKRVELSLWQSAAKDPEVAKAISALFKAISKLQDIYENELKAKTGPSEDSVTTDSKVSLGIMNPNSKLSVEPDKTAPKE